MGENGRGRGGVGKFVAALGGGNGTGDRQTSSFVACLVLEHHGISIISLGPIRRRSGRGPFVIDVS